MKRAVWLVAFVSVLAATWLLWPDTDATTIPATPAAAAITERTATAPATSVARPVATATPERDASDPPSGANVRLTGRVLDDTKQPIANATIRVWPSPRTANAPMLAELTAEANGSFGTGWSPGWPTTVVVEGAALGHTNGARDGVCAGQRITLDLQRLVVFRGRVLARGTNAPLPGAIVQTTVAETVADAEGRYEVTAAMDRGCGFLRGRHPGYFDADRDVRAYGHEPVQIDLLLHAIGTLTLQVVDAETRAPIAGAEIATTFRTGPALRTDEHGSCSLTTHDGQQLSYDVSAAGYAETSWAWQVHDLASSTPRIPLRRLATIAGRVVDDTGRGIEGVLIASSQRDANLPHELPTVAGEAVWAGTFAFSSGPGATTDTNGRFSIRVLPDQEPQHVIAVHDHYATATSAPFVVDTAGAFAVSDLPLGRPATVHGVVRRNGAPVEEAVMTWATATEGNGWTKVDANGDYTLARIRPGAVTLRLFDANGAMLRADIVQLAAGETLRREFVWEEPVTTITGRITTSAGRPCAGHQVFASPQRGSARAPSTTRTTGDGRYSLDVVPGETYRVSVVGTRVTTARDNVAAGTANVDIELPELGLLRLQLRDALTLEPVRGLDDSAIDFAWRRNGEGEFHAAHDAIDAAGRVEARLPVGTVDIAVAATAAGYVPCVVTGLRVTAGAEPAALPVDLIRGATIDIELAQGTPPPPSLADGRVLFFVDDREAALLRGPFPTQNGDTNHRVNGVNLWLGEPGLLHRLVGFDERRVTLRGLTPGRHRLLSFPDDLVFEPAEIDVTPAGGTFTVRWRAR